MKELKSDLKDPPEVPSNDQSASGSGVPSVNLHPRITLYFDTTGLTVYRRVNPPAWTAVGRLLSLL